MSAETTDFAAMVTKEEAEQSYTAEIILNGKVVKSATYGTEQGAMRWITFEVIARTKEGNIAK